MTPTTDPTVTPDEVRTLTLDEARALGGILGRIAPAMLKRHGEYGYTEDPSGRKVLLRLAQRKD